MARVQVLPDAVARRIAAGEVIERPVSVVKELIENSLDAGARRIVVEIDGGGIERIAVTDDGEGMAAEDLALAFRPHATSKIRTEEDLLQIATLGFRGEALPSIAAVADVEVWTRRAADATGAFLHLRGGERLGGGATGTPQGCRIEVRELFFNTPARRKFLKSAQTESGHVGQLLGRIALAAPETEFRFVQNGREALRFPAERPAERIARVLGRELAG
ncbi:MAG: DNA mismatch repair endonuclease MutL, partial [Candidatus Binatia bacterium]